MTSCDLCRPCTNHAHVGEWSRISPHRWQCVPWLCRSGHLCGKSLTHSWFKWTGCRNVIDMQQRNRSQCYCSGSEIKHQDRYRTIHEHQCQWSTGIHYLLSKFITCFLVVKVCMINDQHILVDSRKFGYEVLMQDSSHMTSNISRFDAYFETVETLAYNNVYSFAPYCIPKLRQDDLLRLPEKSSFWLC